MSDHSFLQWCNELLLDERVKVETKSKDPLILQMQPRWFRNSQYSTRCVEAIRFGLGFNNPVLFFDDEDPCCKFPQYDWVRVTSRQWKIPPVSASRLFEWASAGGWVIYDAVDAIPDSVVQRLPSGTTELAIDFLANPVSAFVCSYYDNTDLTIGVVSSL